MEIDEMKLIAMKIFQFLKISLRKYPVQVLFLFGTLGFLAPIPALIAEDEVARLTIDTGGHLGAVSDLLFTPDGNTLISVGGDKTIRCWDVNTGDLQRTFRLQIGDGPEGKLFAGAISPDGFWLAVGGYPIGNGVEGHPLSIIDLETGEIIAILMGHTNVVTAIAFSSDGLHLITGGADSKVRIWELEELKKFNEVSIEYVNKKTITQSNLLEGHVSMIRSVGFFEGRASEAWSSCAYRAFSWKRTNTGQHLPTVILPALSNRDPPIDRAQVSEDGTWLAVGQNSNMFQLWQWNDTAFALQAEKYVGSAVRNLSLSPDGSSILVSSQTGDEIDGCTAIYSIPDLEVKLQFDSHNNAISASAWHPSNELIATAGGDDGEIYLWNPKTGEIATQLSQNGRSTWATAFSKDKQQRVAFGQNRDGYQFDNAKLTSIFDFNELVLSVVDEPVSDLENYQAAVQYISGNLLHREDSYSVYSKDHLFRNHSGYDGWLYSYSFARDEKIILGSKYSLKSYSLNGELTGQFLGHQGAVLAVSPSPDGRYLASGSADHTLRLWNLQNGDLLASLFVARDEEWVCWTPDGYYAASPKGGRYIGWHFNRGIDKLADYLSGDQLAYHFHRPDIVRRVVAENRPSSEIVAEMGLQFDLNEALASAPQVEIVSHSRSETATIDRQSVEVVASEKGNGVSAVRLYHQGTALFPDGPGSMRDGKLLFTYNVSLQLGENRLRAEALNENRIVSAPAESTIRFEGNVPQGDLHLLFVGVDDYLNDELDLEFAKSDASTLSSLLEKGTGGLYQKIHPHFLADSDATKAAVLQKFEEIAKEAKPQDVFVFGFNGHGFADGGTNPNDSKFYLLLHGVTALTDQSLGSDAINDEEFYRAIAKIPALKKIAFIGACQSGALVQNFATIERNRNVNVLNPYYDSALRQLSRSAGVHVFASAQANQFAFESKYLKRGVFTHSILTALSDPPEDPDGDGMIEFQISDKPEGTFQFPLSEIPRGTVSVRELGSFLQQFTPILTEKLSGSAQIPRPFEQGDDFPLIFRE